MWRAATARQEEQKKFFSCRTINSLKCYLHVFSMKKLAFCWCLVYIFRVTKLDELKKHLKPGHAYRRADLARWSTSVDRHVKQLVESGVLKKLSGGLYA